MRRVLSLKHEYRGHPFQEVIECLLKNSNSLEYMAANLETLLSVVHEDLEEANRTRDFLIHLARERREKEKREA